METTKCSVCASQENLLESSSIARINCIQQANGRTFLLDSTEKYYVCTKCISRNTKIYLKVLLISVLSAVFALLLYSLFDHWSKLNVLITIVLGILTLGLSLFAVSGCFRALRGIILPQRVKIDKIFLTYMHKHKTQNQFYVQYTDWMGSIEGWLEKENIDSINRNYKTWIGENGVIFDEYGKF